MSKELILLYDDDKQTRDNFETIFPQLEINLDLLSFEKQDQFIAYMDDETKMYHVRALIFDLAKSDEEIQSKTYSITSYIQDNFHKRRIPIFIHAAFADEYKEFEGYGTVFKIKKSDKSIQEVCDTIQLFSKSGFLDIFRPDGIVESKIMEELHNAFTGQFKKNEIFDIITSISNIQGIDHKSRVIETFQRIAVRSLMSKLMIDKNREEEKFNEVKISAVEHYIRRINLKNISVWTGDIFEIKDKSQKIIILTPRCDVATKGKENLLVCTVENAPELTKKEAEKFMRDNITSKKFRYLPNTPVYEGGKINLSEHFVISDKNLFEKYEYLISLSDDLTNEILGKFCAYLLRTSIPEVDRKELESFFK